MDEQTPNIKQRRKPFLAAFLSLIAFGLGYVYCGRIVRGLVISFFIAFLLPYIAGVFSRILPGYNIKIIGVLILISLFIWFASIIDTFLIARKTKADYELKEYNRRYVYFIFYIFILIITRHVAFNLHLYEVYAGEVSSTSMFPTKQYHERFLVSKNAYKKEVPKRGDIIGFIVPDKGETILSKRVMAVAGDTITIKDNQIFINGLKLERKSIGKVAYPEFIEDSNHSNKAEGELFIEKNGKSEYEIFLADSYGSYKFPDDAPKELYDFNELKVPDNFCFVMGDNRNLSNDSRTFGPIPLSTIKGKVEFLYWPAKDWSGFGPVK